MPFTIDRARLAQLSGEERKEAEEALKILDEVQRTNPLAFFEPHEKQRPFFEASTPIVAAFAGNRFGKTTALVTRALIECCDVESLPQALRKYKRFNADNAPRGVFGRIVNPSFALLDGVILPAFRQWVPTFDLQGGSFDKAFQGPPNRLLRFANGSWIQFMTHEQDLDKFGGSALHFVGYDEPPPKNIREECMMRLADYDGYEMFAMTPLKAHTGWIRSNIFKRREAPDVTVLQGSIHDNPTLDPKAKDRLLAEIGNDFWRAAREFGDFVNVGGLIYPEFERCLIDAPSPALVRTWDVVVGVDPGIRNAGFAFIGFDDENVAYVFDELLLQDKTPEDYAKALKEKQERWGYSDPLYVIDPAARARAQVNAESVEFALARLNIYAVAGQNQVEAGIGQVRGRLQHDRLKVSRECRGLRDEADEYISEDREDGEFKPVKQNDHRLDALRYGLLSRPWYPEIEEEAPTRQLGWVPGQAPTAEWINRDRGGGHPMGSLA